MKRKYDQIDSGRSERHFLHCLADPLVAQAYVEAHKGFKGKMRKSPKGYPSKKQPEPYVQHVIEVAYLLARYLYPTDVVVAGLLHDHVEDLEGWNVRKISKEFNPRVAALVKVVTQPKRGTWKARKDAYFYQVKEGPPNWPEGIEFATAIAACDKIANMRASIRKCREGIPLNAYLNGDWRQHLAVWQRLGTLLPSRVPQLLADEFNLQLDRISSMSEELVR